MLRSVRVVGGTLNHFGVVNTIIMGSQLIFFSFYQHIKIVSLHFRASPAIDTAIELNCREGLSALEN